MKLSRILRHSREGDIVDFDPVILLELDPRLRGDDGAGDFSKYREITTNYAQFTQIVKIIS